MDETTKVLIEKLLATGLDDPGLPALTEELRVKGVELIEQLADGSYQLTPQGFEVVAEFSKEEPSPSPSPMSVTPRSRSERRALASRLRRSRKG